LKIFYFLFSAVGAENKIKSELRNRVENKTLLTKHKGYAEIAYESSVTKRYNNFSQSVKGRDVYLSQITTTIAHYQCTPTWLMIPEGNYC
jgi:hypothetical protein